MSDETPRTEIIAARLEQLSHAVVKNYRHEFTMRVPAEPDRDADLVLSEAARMVRDLSAVRAEVEALRRDGLTFRAFRRANRARCLKWHPAGIESWSPSDWMTAITGELGELASLIKMRNRERDGLPGNKFSPTQQHLASEIADVVTYLDLLAELYGIDLGLAAAEKFNEVSERVGFPDRIPAPGVTGGERKQDPQP